MKEPQEFLAGVWRDVNLLEWQELEKKRALSINKKIKRKNILIYTLSILLMLVMPVLSFIITINPGIVIGVSFIGVTIVFIYECNALKSINENDKESYNI